MNTNFIDISATVSNLVQSTASSANTGGVSGIKGGGKGAKGDGKVFEDQFQQEISKIETAPNNKTGSTAEIVSEAESNRISSPEVAQNFEAGPIMGIRVQGMALGVSSTVADTVETMEGTSGVEFLSKLKQALQEISGGNLKDMVIDAEGLDALKKLLLKAGFDSDEVVEMISDLKEESETKDLSLDEIFSSLSELEVDVDEKADTEVAYLETSALPFVKVLLSELGLGDEDISDIVGGADSGTHGLSLDVVIEKLKAVAVESGNSGAVLSVDDADGSFQAIMARLNLPVQEIPQENVSINDLIKAFEDYKSEKISSAQDALAEASSVLASQSESESITALVNTLFQSISLASTTESISFSYQQIKDQFVNDMMIPSEEDTGQKGLFAEQVTKEAPKSENLVREMVDLVSSSGKTGSGSLEQDRTMASFGKELKTELTKTDAVFQGTTTSGGTDLESSTNTSETRSAPRTLPNYVTNQVGRGIVRAINQGETSLKLQLKPAELGRLTMTIDHQSTGIKVNIVTENHAARDILASNVNELKAALNTAGISLESFEVDMNSDFKQSMANAGNQSGQSGRKNGGSRQGSEFSGQDGEAGDEIASSTGVLAADGSYHFVA